MFRIALSLILVNFGFTLFAQQTPTGRFNLYLIGDAGKVTVNDASYKKILQQQLNDSIPSAIVFLGDNIYPKGMPDADNRNRVKAENILKASVDLAPGFKGEMIFVPGNHDWKRGSPDGLNFVLNQQAWLDSLHRPNIKMLPGNACPGPAEVPLNDNLVLVVIDTQWWLHPWDKYEGESSLCECKTRADLLMQLEDVLRKNAGKRVVVAAHHPLITYGEHGGVYGWKDHIFPLTELNPKLYIPLPGIGSIYPIYRSVFGSIQDLPHAEYKRLVADMMPILERYPGVIYASGHDHSLQYIEKDNVHYIVSGGGAKHGNVKKKKHSLYAASDYGYVRLSVSPDTETNIEYVRYDSIDFKRTLPALAVDTKDSVAQAAIKRGTVLVNASEQYAASGSKRKWLGNNYRDAWAQKIDVPVFDIGAQQGGLKILQRGGGNQTISLRLEDSLGRSYSLRSIEKYPASALPEPLRNTFAKDIVQDQISSAHPYGALVIPYLAAGAGIYHTNPKVVWMPDDPRLGIYQKDVANKLMLFEERPDGKGEGLDFFGSPDKMISTTKLLEQLDKDNDNQVDQKFFLRSRLFDMWIGDWDRHDDQWRWAEFDSKKGKIFRPIPRDRDQAFFVSDGRVPKLLGKKWLLFQFEGFNDHVRWPSGLMFSGRYIDRNFLTTLTREDWIAVADELTAHLTDSVIENAIRQWPDEIYKLHGPQIIEKLKARRATLRNDALEHYEFLAKEVSLVGSAKRERFELHRAENGNVTVKVFKVNKELEVGKLLYAREFLASETKELRIYGLGGDDQFVVTGDRDKDIRIRIIGGAGNDEVDAKRDKGVYVYDLKNEIKISDNASIKDRTATNETVNEYNWKDFKYNRVTPLIYANYNIDDGVFLGGGFMAVTQGFRKNPFKAKHLFLGSYAIGTNSYNFIYDGRFTDVIGKWGLDIDADVKAPNYVNNFFGWGNQSEFNKHIDEDPDVNVDDAIDYYRVRFNEVKLDVKLARKFGQGGFFKIGPSFQRIDIESFDDDQTEDRYIRDVYLIENPQAVEERHYVGASSSWGFDKRNHPMLTTRGIYFEQTSRVMKGIDTQDFTAHNVSVSFYQSFKIPAIVTFAVRAGGGFNTGKYEFYQAQMLGGKTDLRGFRKTRFYGDSKVYFNNEVRIKLASIDSYLFPAYIGVLGFYDVGRVWMDNDPSVTSGKSRVWHHGVGGGIWFTPFNLTAISAEVGHSVEGTVAYLRLGFLF